MAQPAAKSTKGKGLSAAAPAARVARSLPAARGADARRDVPHRPPGGDLVAPAPQGGNNALREAAPLGHDGPRGAHPPAQRGPAILQGPVAIAQHLMEHPGREGDERKQLDRGKVEVGEWFGVDVEGGAEGYEGKAQFEPPEDEDQEHKPAGDVEQEPG